MGIDHTQRRKAGNIGEDAVCGFLVRHGYEIDIIAEKADIIAFVEVKTRTIGSMTSAEEAVDLRKQRLIIRTAKAYLQNVAQPLQCRFDVATVETEGGKVKKLRYYVNAFDASMK